jgi:predicted DNA-binding transcriptional regulator AlpA
MSHPDPVMQQRAKRLLREQRPVREIARLTGLHRDTIRKLAESKASPPPRRPLP